MRAGGVTYVVTVYNKAPYIAGALRAIRGQRGNFDRQIVVVDDGSTDDSAAIAAATIAGWPDAVLVRQSNGGPSVATNRGLREAKMPFAHLVDGDDVLAPYATRVLLRAQQQSGCGVIYGRGSWYASAEDIRFPDEPRDVSVNVLQDTLFTTIRRGISGSSALLVDTEAARRVGGCDEEVFIQDHSLPQRMASVATIGLIDDLLSLGPQNEPGRLMKSGEAQLLHDQSLAALHTLRDSPHLGPRYRRLVQKQATGRAWKWALRKDGASLVSKFYWLFVLAHVPFVLMSDTLLESTLEAFGRNNEIRRNDGRNLRS
jgi:hypothetical protein